MSKIDEFNWLICYYIRTSIVNSTLNKSMKSLYENLWVPILGRLLFRFSTILEGKKHTQKQSYD